jgi:hypothetical protein
MKITACDMVSCCTGRLAVRRAAAWYFVGGVKEEACRPPDRQPTTTTGHYNTCCNLQSYAPEDGQNIARNMLS